VAGLFEVTWTVTVHPAGGMVAPVSPTLMPIGVADGMPPHVVVDWVCHC
jgi:hypothetical protein